MSKSNFLFLLAIFLLASIGLILRSPHSPSHERGYASDSDPLVHSNPATVSDQTTAAPTPPPEADVATAAMASRPSLADETPAPPLRTETAESPVLVDEAPRTMISAPSASSKTTQKLWFWLGGGIALTSNGQVSTDRTNLNYESATPSATSIGLGMLWGPRWGIEGVFACTPGRVQSESGLTVNRGSYRWETGTLELLYAPDPIWKIRFGIQRQSLPLFVPNVAGTEISITENQIDMVSIGFTYLLSQKDPWETSIDMKYQHPVSQSLTSANTSLDISPHYSLEGSINQTYHFPKTPYRVGVSWSGQAIHQDFRYNNGSVALDGSRQIFRSTIEGRIYISF